MAKKNEKKEEEPQENELEQAMAQMQLNNQQLQGTAQKLKRLWAAKIFPICLKSGRVLTYCLATVKRAKWCIRYIMISTMTSSPQDAVGFLKLPNNGCRSPVKSLLSQRTKKR